MRGTLKVFGVFAELLDFKAIIEDSPDSPFNNPDLISVWEINKPYHNGIGGYMKVISYDENTYTIQNYETVSKINGTYRGVIKSGKEQSYYYGRSMFPVIKMN